MIGDFVLLAVVLAIFDVVCENKTQFSSSHLSDPKESHLVSQKQLEIAFKTAGDRITQLTSCS